MGEQTPPGWTCPHCFGSIPMEQTPYADRHELNRLEAALVRIAARQRPDGTHNLSREACGELARAALAPTQKEN